MLDPRDAWERLLPHLDPLPPETCTRRVAAGRVLARSLDATVDVPALDVSAMDGYAVVGPATPGEHRSVVGTVAAGDPPGFELPSEAASRIMTGAPVPASADRVIPVELTDGGRTRVRLDRSVPDGANIRRRGEVLHAGAPLLDPGTLLTPGALSLLATHGYGEVSVHRCPRVAVLTTGNELVSPDSEPVPGQLRDSNTDFLLAAGASLGLGFESLGIGADDPDELQRLVARGLDADVLLLSGGVSKGEFDYVEAVLAELGCRPLFTSVAIQPGKPLVAFVHDRGLVFGLPGNPASVMVTFWLFVRPSLRRLLGLADGYWYGSLSGYLAAPLPGAGNRERFLPAEVAFVDTDLRVTPCSPKGSHDLATFARGTALVRVAAGAEPLPAGARCEVLPLADWRTPWPVQQEVEVES